MQTQYYAGWDGGGTKTLCRVLYQDGTAPQPFTAGALNPNGTVAGQCEATVADLLRNMAALPAGWTPAACCASARRASATGHPGPPAKCPAGRRLPRPGHLHRRPADRPVRGPRRAGRHQCSSRAPAPSATAKAPMAAKPQRRLGQPDGRRRRRLRPGPGRPGGGRPCRGWPHCPHRAARCSVRGAAGWRRPEADRQDLRTGFRQAGGGRTGPAGGGRRRTGDAAALQIVEKAGRELACWCAGSRKAGAAIGAYRFCGQRAAKVRPGARRRQAQLQTLLPQLTLAEPQGDAAAVPCCWHVARQKNKSV